MPFKPWGVEPRPLDSEDPARRRKAYRLSEPGEDTIIVGAPRVAADRSTLGQLATPRLNRQRRPGLEANNSS